LATKNFLVVEIDSHDFNLSDFLLKVPIIPEYLFELDHPNETAEVLAILKSKEKIILSPNLSFSLNPKYDEDVYSMYTKSVDEVTILMSKFDDTDRENKKYKYLTAEEKKWKNVQMNKLNTKIGLMFASKPLVQLLTNPFIGPLTNR
jgi:hypothetical protein